MGNVAALLGSALAVKPLLQIEDGRIVPLEKVRTSAKAISRLEELAVAAASDAAVDVAVSHLDNPDRADELAGRLQDLVPNVQRVLVTEVGAVIGAHVGPGMLAVVVSPHLGPVCPFGVVHRATRGAGFSTDDISALPCFRSGP